MSTNYTPAPWAAHKTPNDPDFTHEISGVAAIYMNENSKANARLIAAAPEMQTMLIRLLDEVMMDEAVFSKIAPLTLEQARMAIAKSKGEQPCATN